MPDRSSTGGYDPSGIDLDAWTKLEEQLEESIPPIEARIREEANSRRSR